MTTTLLDIKELKEEPKKERNVGGWESCHWVSRDDGEAWNQPREEMGGSRADAPQDSKPSMKNHLLAQKVSMLGKQVDHRIPRTPKDLDQSLRKNKSEISELKNI